MPGPLAYGVGSAKATLTSTLQYQMDVCIGVCSARGLGYKWYDVGFARVGAGCGLRKGRGWVLAAQG